MHNIQYMLQTACNLESPAICKYYCSGDCILYNHEDVTTICKYGKISCLRLDLDEGMFVGRNRIEMPPDGIKLIRGGVNFK